MIEIGRRLTEMKKICGHGNWLQWLQREFGWTDRQALNYMRVHKPRLADCTCWQRRRRRLRPSTR